MTTPSASKDKFLERVINPYLAEVLRHPQTIEMRDGLLHIRDVEGPKGTGSVESRLEAMEQQVFKCQGMVERGINASHKMLSEFTNNYEPMPRTPRRPSLSYKRRSSTSKPKFMICKIKTVSMNIDSKG